MPDAWDAANPAGVARLPKAPKPPEEGGVAADMGAVPKFKPLPNGDAAGPEALAGAALWDWPNPNVPKPDAMLDAEDAAGHGEEDGEGQEEGWPKGAAARVCAGWPNPEEKA